MQALDTTIANVALPYMQGSVSASSAQINWVLTSYIVAAAIMTPPSGFLANRFGRKRVLMVAIAGFLAASVLCGLAQSLVQIVEFRLLQGFFGAALVPIAQSILLDIYTPEERGLAMAFFGVSVMVAPVLGPVIGGWLTDQFSCRWVFYIDVPIGAVAFLGVSTFMRETEASSAVRMDWIGFGSLCVAIGALQVFLDRGAQLDWFSSLEILIEATLCVSAFYVFLVHTFTVEHSFVDPRLFLDRNFSLGMLFIFIVGVTYLASMSLLTPYLQKLMGYPVVTAGLVMGSRGVGTMICMFLVERGNMVVSYLLIRNGQINHATISAYVTGSTARSRGRCCGHGAPLQRRDARPRQGPSESSVHHQLHQRLQVDDAHVACGHPAAAAAARGPVSGCG